MKLQFLGATRQVTGSSYLLEAGGLRILVDCGLYQERAFLERNWAPWPVPPDSIDYLILTHAHLDHSGLIPKLVHEGFQAPIITTAASVELAEIILTDAGHIQEEDARFKKSRHQREGRTVKRPVKPLYTSVDVREALPLFQKARYGEKIRLNKSVSVVFHDAGHILGSSMLEFTVSENNKSRTVVFSGDIGQKDKPVIRDPTTLDRADYVVLESTYGARDHAAETPIVDQLCDVINHTVEAGGNILIPTFAVERAQELMYYLRGLVAEDRIPHLMVFLDSPMAVDVTDVFRRHPDCFDEEAIAILDAGETLFGFRGMTLVKSSRDSKSINRIRGSCIILAGSGMCTAGRIKHHLVKNISRPESAVVFVGYQAEGTLGRELVSGRSPVRIHGRNFEVKARIEQVHGLSAHADRAGLLEWMDALKGTPQRVFITHGEEEGAKGLAAALESRWGFAVEVPAYRAEYELD